MQLQTAQLPEGDGEDPQVEGNVDGGVGPGNGVEVNAVTRLGLGPSRPVGVDGGALKDADEDKGDGVEAYEDAGAPEDAPGVDRGEDADVKGDEGELDERGSNEVGDDGKVEALERVRDLVDGERPHVVAEVVVGLAVDGHGRRRGSRYSSHNHDPVVAREALDDKLFEHQTRNDNEGHDGV